MGERIDGYRYAREGRLVLDGDDPEFLAGYRTYHANHRCLDDCAVGFDQDPGLGVRAGFLGEAPLRLTRDGIEIGSGVSVIYNPHLHRVIVIGPSRTLYLERFIHPLRRVEYRFPFECSVICVWV